jgi:hypothetical protein
MAFMHRNSANRFRARMAVDFDCKVGRRRLRIKVKNPGEPRDTSVGPLSVSPAPRALAVRELEQAFVVSDANGQALAYVYFRHDANEARQANALMWDEARRIAANIARLPEFLGRPPQRVEPMPNDPEALIAWGKRNIVGEE